jgi:hypothetical protein
MFSVWRLTAELVYCYHSLRNIRMQQIHALRPDSSVVERGPEKAGVGGSIPSLATTLYCFAIFQVLSVAQSILKSFSKNFMCLHHSASNLALKRLIAFWPASLDC